MRTEMSRRRVVVFSVFFPGRLGVRDVFDFPRTDLALGEGVLEWRLHAVRVRGVRRLQLGALRYWVDAPACTWIRSLAVLHLKARAVRLALSDLLGASAKFVRCRAMLTHRSQQVFKDGPAVFCLDLAVRGERGTRSFVRVLHLVLGEKLQSSPAQKQRICGKREGNRTNRNT